MCLARLWARNEQLAECAVELVPLHVNEQTTERFAHLAVGRFVSLLVVGTAEARHVVEERAVELVRLLLQLVEKERPQRAKQVAGVDPAGLLLDVLRRRADAAQQRLELLQVVLDETADRTVA